MPNMEMIDKILDHIEAHPETWNQKSWAQKVDCGTAFCVAGHAVAMTYPKAQFLFDQYWKTADVVELEPDGEERHVSELAREILDLNEYQGDALFDEANTLSDLRAKAERLRNGDQFYDYC